MSNSYLNYFEEISLGNHSQKYPVHKFGAAPSGLQTTITDVWSRANAAVTQQIWLAPTAARIHTISSDSASDVTNGTGIDSVKVYYLPDWNSRETTETLTGNIDAGIAMANAAVMINRMQVIPQATTTNVGGNAGTIIATAATDSTITAVILPSNGQTEMAILGIPSIQTFLMYSWFVGIDRTSGAAAHAEFQFRVNPNPDVQTLAFLRVHDIPTQSTGTTANESHFKPPAPHVGPAIFKVQAISSANDLDAEASFAGVLVDN